MEKELEITANWRCFPLHPETPPEGISLARLFNRSEEEIAAWMEGFRQTAAGLGLPFGMRSKTFNSRLAQELGLWARKQGKGDHFQMALFKAYLVEERNIASKDVLLDLTESIGLSPLKAGEVIESRSFSDAVDNDWALARSLGITAVPTLVMGEERLIGAKPYEEIVDFVRSNLQIRNDGS